MLKMLGTILKAAAITFAVFFTLLLGIAATACEAVMSSFRNEPFATVAAFVIVFGGGGIVKTVAKKKK